MKKNNTTRKEVFHSDIMQEKKDETEREGILQPGFMEEPERETRSKKDRGKQEEKRGRCLVL